MVANGHPRRSPDEYRDQVIKKEAEAMFAIGPSEAKEEDIREIMA
jgi:hypothetical protein